MRRGLSGNQMRLQMSFCSKMRDNFITSIRAYHPWSHTENINGNNYEIERGIDTLAISDRIFRVY